MQSTTSECKAKTGPNQTPLFISLLFIPTVLYFSFLWLLEKLLTMPEMSLGFRDGNFSLPDSFFDTKTFLHFNIFSPRRFSDWIKIRNFAFVFYFFFPSPQKWPSWYELGGLQRGNTCESEYSQDSGGNLFLGSVDSEKQQGEQDSRFSCCSSISCFSHFR